MADEVLTPETSERYAGVTSDSLLTAVSATESTVRLDQPRNRKASWQNSELFGHFGVFIFRPVFRGNMEPAIADRGLAAIARRRLVRPNSVDNDVTVDSCSFENTSIRIGEQI